MVTRTYTAAHLGLDVYPVEVEVDGKQGIPQFILIGLASRAVEEAKERITSALHNCGIRVRSKRTIVNLAPASVPKSGTAFDLAIIIGLLKMYGELSFSTERTIFLGELALDGQIKPVPGVLPLVLGAKKLGFGRVVIPKLNWPEVSTIRGIEIFVIEHLKELFMIGKREELRLKRVLPQSFQSVAATSTLSVFSQIVGQEKVKRALVLAAAGGHHLLMIGPPGSGKTQLARTLPELLPPLNEQESIELTAVHSVAGLSPQSLVQERPFRSPHHSISRTGLLGGGNPLKPGELSLAHHGVLFLDELLEFPGNLLDMLRQPLEEKRVTLSLSSGRTSFPAATTLVAATNPCPCGYFGSGHKPCTCSPGTVDRYRQKLSGPLLDRFDLQLRVDQERQLFADTYSTQNNGDALNSLRRSITRCRQHQQQRYARFNCTTVHQLTSTQLKESLQLPFKAQQTLRKISFQKDLTSRGYWSLLRVAQTIADLEESATILPEYLQEAADFREL
ncbi:YifB family Mg chelatase-like AAA ATPase [Patescibacteria group bacterium]|nr:YifB family Mg chelatase-like AAA ATPase [Patescibacteria group bacterium]